MTTRAVIFDFDGVVIDSREVQREAFFKSYELVNGNGVPNFEEFLSHAGDSLSNIFQKMNLPQEMIRPYQEISAKNINKIKVFPGIRNLLHELRSKGIKIGLCTGKDRVRTLEILEYHKLKSLFDIVICSDDVIRPKPHPDSLLTCMHALRVSADKTVMVGDAVYDILCAKNCQVFTIAVSWGVNKREVLEQYKPDLICTTVPELRLALAELTDQSSFHLAKGE